MSGGASHLASIYGSELDKVNCSFYLKIGACRHGDRCSRKHIKPNFSQTIVLQNLYQNPNHNAMVRPDNMDKQKVLTEREVNDYFDLFYEDIFTELAQYGQILEMYICENVGDHLLGNVYVRYNWEDQAAGAVEKLQDRWYAGRPVFCELSPVSDFREACCRQHDIGECNRGGFCNFMHIKRPGKRIQRDLMLAQAKERLLHPDPREQERRKELDALGIKPGTVEPVMDDEFLPDYELRRRRR